MRAVGQSLSRTSPDQHKPCTRGTVTKRTVNARANPTFSVGDPAKVHIASLSSLFFIVMIIFLLCITTPLNPTSTSFFLFFNDIRDPAVCTNLIPALASSTYTNKCNQATRYFFELLNPRVRHHLQSPPGFDHLPYSFATSDYRIPLDVLNDPKAGDFFALRAIGREYQVSF